MKTALKILSLALIAMLFTSCSQEAIYYDASGNSVTSATEMSSKGKFVEPVAPVVVKKEPCKIVPKERKCAKRPTKKKETKTAAQKQGCIKCLSFYCAKPDRCGVVSDSVLSRATMQGGTGEPQLGLIPTMKTLAP